MITMLCEHCESDAVVLDAYAMWSVEAQDWTLASTYDLAWCTVCDVETTLIEKELTND